MQVLRKIDLGRCWFLIKTQEVIHYNGNMRRHNSTGHWIQHSKNLPGHGKISSGNFRRRPKRKYIGIKFNDGNESR